MNRASGGFMGVTRWPALLALAVMGLCACDYSRYERGFPISDRALREAQPFDLAAVSTSQPTTKPAVTTTPSTKPAEELLPPPPAQVELPIEECRRLALASNHVLKVERLK